MMIKISWFSVLFCALSLHAAPVPLLANRVVKVMGHNDRGRMSMGSGVVIAANRVATNCHVISSANRITVLKASQRYPVVGQVGDPGLDVCLLHLTNLPLQPVPLGSLAQTAAGDKVYAFGYPNAIGISMRSGVVTHLHPFRSSFIIETDIGIRNGASGGGLFTAEGRLIGLTTFFRKDQGGRYYAVPVDWPVGLLPRKAQPIVPFSAKPFWQTATLFQQQKQ